MNKTRVDDMLIEMIKPKIDEIEKKFSNNEGLTQDDINTLLLKSQYNHINHLDDKLNEIVESVKNLEHRFDNLENRFNNLELKFEHLEEKVSEDIQRLENKLDTSIQKALNKNMVVLITIIGFFFTLLKIAELFSK